MVFVLEGKVAIITGAASGLGYQIAKTFLKKGLKGVALLDVNENGGANVEKEFKKLFGINSCLFIKTDITVEEQIRIAFKLTIKTFNQLDIVINNAGISADKHAEKLVCINLVGTIYGTQLAIDEYLPRYKNGEEGVIINISSLAGLYPWEAMPVYAASKHGVVALTRSYGAKVHYERSKVKVIAICPGYMETPMTSGGTENCAYPDIIKAFTKEVPKQTAESVAERLLGIIENGSIGSVWVIEGSEAPYEVKFLILRKDSCREVKFSFEED